MKNAALERERRPGETPRETLARLNSQGSQWPGNVKPLKEVPQASDTRILIRPDHTPEAKRRAHLHREKITRARSKLQLSAMRRGFWRKALLRAERDRACREVWTWAGHQTRYWERAVRENAKKLRKLEGSCPATPIKVRSAKR